MLVATVEGWCSYRIFLGPFVIGRVPRNLVDKIKADVRRTLEGRTLNVHYRSGRVARLLASTVEVTESLTGVRCISLQLPPNVDDRDELLGGRVEQQDALL